METAFCSCCAAHVMPPHEWTEACEVMCAEQLRMVLRENSPTPYDWGFDDFAALPPSPPALGSASAAMSPTTGPAFEQPALSLVEDAAVVLGDCYNLGLRSSEILDRAGATVGTSACLMPPVPRKLFESDAHLTLNLSVCPSSVAPFHMHDPQPAAAAAMICFDECRTANFTVAPQPPPDVDESALYLANCTRRCFASCVRPIASECAAGCDAANYSCFGACHREAQTCSIPLGPRDLRTFRMDPNAEVCSDYYDGYEGCVHDCSADCHEELRLARRTVHDDIDDWYNASCTPPLALAATLVSSCMLACQDNCTQACNQSTYSLGPELWEGPALANCTQNCSAGCLDVCFTIELLDGYQAGCRPQEPYNCTEQCLGEVCAPLVTFCSAFEPSGRLRHIDVNCTGSTNLTYQTYWANISTVDGTFAELLSQPSSPLAMLVGINASHHVCYDECSSYNTTHAALTGVAPSGLFFHGSDRHVAANCTHVCYAKACLNSCLSNCTLEAEMAALPPCVPGADCLSPSNCSVAELHGNCSAVKAFEPVVINISAVTANLSLWVPPWDEAVCDDLIMSLVDSFATCTASCPTHCELACPLPPNVSTLLDMDADGPITWLPSGTGGVLYNDTSGACLRDCYVSCTANCSLMLVDSVESTWCATPSEPVEYCEPPTNCTADCSHECLDPTYLLATDPDCEEHLYKKTADGGNLTVVVLPYAFNVSTSPICSRNFSLSDCTEELLYYNVTEYRRDLVVSEGCVQRCFERCTERCFDEYCITRLEVPVNETAICLPRCLHRFFEDADAQFAWRAEEAAAANYTACYAGTCHPNTTSCQLACDNACLAEQSANCSLACDHIYIMEDWQACLAQCYANASGLCAPYCVYECTSNHTLAYGFAAPYDASGDYYTLDDLYAAAELDDFNAATYGPYAYLSTNSSRACHTNCTLYCASACLDKAHESGACDEARSEAAAERAAQGLPVAHPRLVAEAHNNCTILMSAPCLANCRGRCTSRCANRTDTIPADVLLDRQITRVYDEVVESCEAKCRVQIYGRNVSREEECQVYDASFHQDCLSNCSNAARLSCVDVNSTIDIVHVCNTSCVYLYVEPESIVERNESERGEGLFADGNAPPPMPPPVLDKLGNVLYNIAYDTCMDKCQTNYTTSPNYECDGGVKRIAAFEAATTFYELATDGIGTQGITPHEQLEIDRLQAAVPKGEVCTLVDLDCVYNASLGCDGQCAEQVAYYYQLCIFRYEARRNATFDYNISHCHAPEGWRIGDEKWRYYADINASSPLAKRSAHYPHTRWRYDDVEDETILNCTCAFHNESFDPQFVAAIIEYDMRAYRDQYLSTCLCLFNATEGEPQHCVQSNFSNIYNVYDWVFGNKSLAAPPPDYLVEHAEAVGECSDGCVVHCTQQCGAFFVEHLEPSDPRWELNNRSEFLYLYNETFRSNNFPLSLYGWNVSEDGEYVTRPGHWRSPQGCFQPCMHTCAVTNCTSDCRNGCAEDVVNGNETAQAFGCFWNATHEEGRGLCDSFCQCHDRCASGCVASLDSLNTSLQMLSYLPSCTANCSDTCEAEHDEVRSVTWHDTIPHNCHPSYALLSSHPRQHAIHHALWVK